MAIRSPKRFASSAVRTKGNTDCHTSDIGHWFAMTVETLSTSATTRLQSLQNAGDTLSANFLTALGAVRKSPAEAVLATAQRVAKRKRLVSAQPQETTADGTPPDGPKSRKLHYGEFVEKQVRLPSFPRIKARFQRAALEPFGVSFSSIFLHEKKDGAAGGTGSFAKYQVG